MQKVDLSYYLKNKDIYILNKKIPKEKNEDDNNIFKQIDNIVSFHSKIGPYKENLFPRIGGSIGKEINNYYSQIILVIKYLNELQYKERLNSIDFYLINRGETLVKCGRKVLEHVHLNNFRGLIERSMKNYEVCLSRVDEGNLKVEEDGKIVIGTIKYLTYNLREHDVYSYIKKIKRRETNLSINEIINYYIEITNLKEDSREYLRGLASYPNEEFRILEKYVQGKLQEEDKTILENLHLARKIDDNGIII